MIHSRAAALGLLILAISAVSLAQEEKDTRMEAVRELKETRQISVELLTRVLPLMADSTMRPLIRKELLGREEFPANYLAMTLGHPELAVRLASIELLEEKAGGDFDFNPWLEPGKPEAAGPLARWAKWAESNRVNDGEGPLLGQDQRRGYLRDLLSNDTDKAARARSMLQTDGMESVGFLEQFLNDSSNLPPGKRAKVRQAQYQIVLSRSRGSQAPTIARQLAFGSRDQMLGAIGSLRSSGLVALPILRDFIRHPDPLVRETAMDSMLTSGGAQTLEVVGPVLRDERDANVIHGALRRLKDVPGDASLELVIYFLDHEDEDLQVSATQACLKLSGGDSGMGFMSGMGGHKPTKSAIKSKADDAVLALLDSKSWRVRATALEYVAGRKLTNKAKEKVVLLLDDPDEFVRFQALKSAAAIKATDALPKLKQMFLSNPDMVGPVLEAYGAFNKAPDQEMINALDGFPPNAKLSVISAARSQSSLSDTVIGFASDENLDVACAALRYLGSYEDRVEKGEIATALLNAIRDEQKEKRQAVLDRLDLPEVKAVDPELEKLMNRFSTPTDKTALDGLYDAFLAVGASSSGREIPAIPGALGKLIKEIEKIAKSDDEDAFRAALVLGRSGNPEGLKQLIRMLPKLNTARKAAIAEKLYNPTQSEALELLRLLIREPVVEVRRAAASAALSNSESPAFHIMVLEELVRPGAVLQVHEVSLHRMSNASRRAGASSVMRNWAMKVFEDSEASVPHKVLALMFMDIRDRDLLKKQTTHSSPWVRRAAYHALGRISLNDFSELLPQLVKEDMPQVRAVLPEVTGRTGVRWHHRFSDVHSSPDESYDSTRSQRVLNKENAEALQKMSRTDPSSKNRFAAAFSLLTHGRTIDIDVFAQLISQQPEESRASYYVASWMSENSARLGPAFVPVFSALDTTQTSPRHLQKISAAISGKGKSNSGFTSFEALVARDQEARSDDAKLLAPAPPAIEVKRESLKLIYFFKPGCRDCAKVSGYIDGMRSEFPLLEVEEHNILEGDSTVLNQALCDRFAVPAKAQNVAPSLFVQSGFLVKDQIIPSALGDLLTSAMKLPQNDAWSVVGEQETELAAEQVVERYDSLTLPIVVGAGLLDGVNPCAFATIIFFLSYLQIAKRTPREMLMVGASFILAVFLAYFAAGIVLHKVLAAITEQVQGIQKWLNVVFGLLALVAAGFSLRDAMLARSGRADEMTLQLPAFLKTRIREVIRTRARARRFVVAAFVAGVLISLLELACTGQVYAPIIYQIQKGQADAIGMLLLYNLAFIFPLVVIFFAVWAGMSSEALIRIQKKSTFGVKIMLALLFFVLAVVILLGEHILP